MAVYARYGAPPTQDLCDSCAATPNSPDQELRILSPLEGTYYIGIYGGYLPSRPVTYSLSVATTNLSVRNVTPSTVGNGGSATVRIDGDNFEW